MKDRTKTGLLIVGMVVLCILLIFGISRVLYREPEQTLADDHQTGVETEIVTETGDIIESTETAESKSDMELVIEMETGTTVENGTQEIQEQPIKTEDEKPQEPPALAESADIENPETEPVYEEVSKKEESSEKAGNAESFVNDAPKNGDAKDGMVYVEGFGWLPDEGAGVGTNADDMYENGNKVGIMD